MTGKQIAQNLRRSRRKWGTNVLYSSGYQTYCVLGIKAAEKGVSVSVLEWFDDTEPKTYGDLGVSKLVNLNDNAESKEGLIAALEAKKYANKRFNVERFVNYLKTVQRKRLHRKKE